MTAVETHNLGHRYGEREALRDLDASWPAERVTAVLGPNGSGKSTLFRILTTALIPTTGTAIVAGFDVRKRPSQVRGALGAVFQSPALDPELTVTENLEVFAALHGMSRRAASRTIPGLLRALNIEDRASERVSRLSGGLRRRADLARSLVHEPSIVLLDEPTAGLDPGARSVFWSTLDRLRAERSVSLVVSTHDFDEAARADHMVILDRGRIAVQGAPGDLVAALGEEALWIDCDRPEEVGRLVDSDHTVQVAGSRVRISGPSLGETLMRLRAAPGIRPRSMELRPPDLSDVYESATGHRWSDSGEAPA